MCISRNLQVIIRVFQRTFLLRAFKAYLDRQTIKISFFVFCHSLTMNDSLWNDNIQLILSV
jgi:hypothetical protein